MKRFLVAAMVFAGGAAFAHDQVEQNAKEPERSLNDVDRHAPDATDVTSYTSKQWQAFKKQADIGTKNRADTRELKQAAMFSLKGTVADAGGSHLKVKRDGMPDADFDIRKESKVLLDGREVEAKYLPKGADVTVKFNLDGNDAIALSVLANNDAIGGSGATKADDKADKAADKADKAEDKAEMKADDAANKMDNAADDAKADTKAEMKDTKAKTTKTKKQVSGHVGAKKGADKADIPTKAE